MATDTQMDIGLLEKVGDTLSSLSEGFVGFLTRLLGSSNENFVRKLGYIRSRDKMSYSVTPGSLLAQVNDPGFEFTSRPQRIGHFTAFLNRIGTMKTKVENWKDLFWETAHHLQGN